MARKKKIPYKPDPFQRKGQAAAEWLFDRTVIIIGALAVIILVLVVGSVISHTNAAAEEDAWTAYYKTGAEIKNIKAALGEYGSCGATPYLLLSLARVEARAPTDDSGKPVTESAEDRTARLDKVDGALKRLVDEHPEHHLRLYGLMFRGEIQEELGRSLDAVETFKLAIQSEPGSLEPKILYHIGRNYYLADRPEDARQYLGRAVELTTKELMVPAQYGRRMERVKPVWRENAEYLLARLGRGERAIPEAPAPAAKPTPEATENKPAGETESAPEAAAKDAPKEAAPTEADTPKPEPAPAEAK